MTKEEKMKVQQRIEEELCILAEDLTKLEKLVVPIAPDNAIGRITRMEAINSRSVNEARLNQTRLKRRQLEAMLAHIDKPDFGCCAVCGQPIPVERLIWLPESDRCVRCAS